MIEIGSTSTGPNPIAAVAGLFPDLSGRALAEALGYSQAQWQRWSSGSTGMRTDSLVQVLASVREVFWVEVVLTVTHEGEWTATVTD